MNATTTTTTTTTTIVVVVAVGVKIVFKDLLMLWQLLLPYSERFLSLLMSPKEKFVTDKKKMVKPSSRFILVLLFSDVNRYHSK